MLFVRTQPFFCCYAVTGSTAAPQFLISKTGEAYITELYCYSNGKSTLSESTKETLQQLVGNVLIESSFFLQSFLSLCYAEALFHSPANIYLFKVSNRKTRNRCEICSNLTITPMQLMSFWYLFYCQLLTDSAYCSGVSIVDFKQANASLEVICSIELQKML